MRKKIFLFIITFIISLLFLPKVEAKDYDFTCTYIAKDPNATATLGGSGYNTNGKKITISFNLTGNSLKVNSNEYSMNTISDWTGGNKCPESLSIDESQKIYIDSSKGQKYYNSKVIYCAYDYAALGKNEDTREKLALTKEEDSSGNTVYYYGDGNGGKIYATYLTIYTPSENIKANDVYFILHDTNYIDSKGNLYNLTGAKDFAIRGVGDGNKCPDITYRSGATPITIVGAEENKDYLPQNKDKHVISGQRYHKDDTETKDDTGTTNSSCTTFTVESTCETAPDIACIWVKNENAPGGGYCNVDNLLYVGCGGASDIPMQVPQLISMFVNLLKIATPIILIFISVISLVKALAAQKDDEIKKAQASLVKKIIAAAMVFFVIAIVQFVISKVANDDEYSGITDCFNCFLNNSCTETTYYKTVVGGTDMCTRLTEGETKTCEDLFKKSKQIDK